MDPIDVLIQEATQLVAQANDSAADAESEKKATDARAARQERIAKLHENIRDSLKAMKEHHGKIKSATEELKTLGTEGDELEKEGTERKRRVVGDSTALDLILQSNATDGATDEGDAVSILKFRSRNRGFTSAEAHDAAVTEAATQANDGSDDGLDGLDAVSIMKLRSQNGGLLPGEQKRGAR